MVLQETMPCEPPRFDAADLDDTQPMRALSDEDNFAPTATDLLPILRSYRGDGGEG
jgi:hypothetical protein